MQVTGVEFKKWLYLALFCFLLLVDSDKFFADEIKKKYIDYFTYYHWEVLPWSDWAL